MNKASFFSELKRRRVIRVAIIYATAVWVTIQLADILFEAFEVENWVMQALVAASIALFPAVVIAAWFIDWTSKGLEITDVEDVMRISDIHQDPSIAVLPFSDISPAGDYEYFAHGISEEITVRLAKFDWLNVAARTSAFGIRKLEDDLEKIGERLGVSTLLDGTVQIVQDRIRVRVELADVERGLTLWAEHLDGEMSDVFRIQDSMAENVVAALGQHLDVNNEHQDEHPTPDNEPPKEAYNLYLEARYHYNKATPIERDTAAQLYTKVIRQAPDYAPAYAGLAIARAVTLIGGSEAVSPMDTMPPARDAAMRALEIDPHSAEAMGALAWITMVFDWEFQRAGEQFQRALEYGRNANLLVGYAMYLNCAGKLDEAIAAAEEAIDVEPLSLVALSGSARFYRYAERWDEAFAACEQLLALDSTSKAAGINLFEINMARGDHDAAHEAIELERKFAGEEDLGVIFHTGRLAAFQHNQDQVRSSRERLINLRDERYVPPFMPAVLSLLLGEYDSVFKWLEEGCRTRDAYLVDMPRFRMPKAIRSDPRYDEINDRIGVLKFRQQLEADNAVI